MKPNGIFSTNPGLKQASPLSTSLRLTTWKPGNEWSKFWSESKAREPALMSHIRLGEFTLHFFVLVWFIVDWIIHWVKEIFTQATDSNANVFQKHSHGHTQKYFTSFLGIA